LFGIPAFIWDGLSLASQLSFKQCTDGEHFNAHEERKGKVNKRPKIVCSPSYVDIRSRANTTRGLDFEHMIKARAHKEGVRIDKTPKKLASICCP
jgi:hypothetical protein